ncbi:MAG: hypothetical protein Pars93KO_14380 [Parasphingorhabdus sp.]
MGKSFCEPVNALGHWALKNLSRIDAARESFDIAKEMQNAAPLSVCLPTQYGHWIVSQYKMLYPSTFDFAHFFHAATS